MTGIDGRSWVDAVKEISVSYLDLLVVGEIGAQDIYCNWHAIREIDEAGALLVRPDGVIAWRNKSGVADSKVAKRELAHALAAVLSNEQASQ